MTVKKIPIDKKFFLVSWKIFSAKEGFQKFKRKSVNT